MVIRNKGSLKNLTKPMWRHWGFILVGLGNVFNVSDICLDVLKYLWNSRGRSFGEAFPRQE